MKYNVSGIGNPLLDITLQVQDSFLLGLGFKKGSMHLINQEEAEKLLNMNNHLNSFLSPGGSVANVLAGVCSLGGKSIFLGKIGRDPYGQ